MADEGSADMVRALVQAYRSSGIAAKVYRGNMFVEREGGWEGPIDPRRIQATYREDIGAIERNARAAALLVIAGLSERLRGWLDNHRAYASGLVLTPERFQRLGLDHRRVRLYASVAVRLHRTNAL